jgi:hypothetical protein
MIILSIFGLIFSLFGTLILGLGFRFGTPKYTGTGYTYEFDGQEPLVAYYKNPIIRTLGWFIFGLGQLLTGLGILI